MRDINLRIDTNFGIPEFDYTNSSIHQINTHNKLIENLDNQIRKRFRLKISEAKYYFEKYGYNTNTNINDGYLTENLVYNSYLYLTDQYGPDQSYFGNRGEFNSIEIYLNILKTMWNDYIPPKKIVNRRKVKKGINKTINILIKIAFYRLKKKNKIKIGPSKPIGLKGFKIFITHQ